MQLVNIKGISSSKGHYSAGLISNNQLYISGMLSVDPKTVKACKGDIRAQTKTALNKIEKVLGEVSLTKNDVFMCRIYTTDLDYWDDINEVYADFFLEHRPARVIVPVTKLHFGCLIEIEAIAEVKSNER